MAAGCGGETNKPSTGGASSAVEAVAATNLFHERFDGGEILVADANDFDAAILVFFLNLRQVRDAGAAGRTPRCPKLDHMHAARDIDRLAFHPVGHGQGRCRLT